MLSISAIAEPGNTTLPSRSITAYYETSVERIIDWTAELVLSAAPGDQPRTVFVPDQLHDRGSTAQRHATNQHATPLPQQVMV